MIIRTFSVQNLCPSAGNIIKITLQELHVLVCTHFVERVAVHTVNDLMQQPLFVCSIFLLTLYLPIVGFQDVRLFKPYAAKQEWNTTAHV